MTNKEFKGDISWQWGAFIIFLIFAFAVRFYGDWTVENSNNIYTVDEKVTYNYERILNLEQENESLKQLVIETSGVPNEKRKAIFELKIQQDSILMELLQGDINTNKEILRLLETDWVFNNDTEFESLKTK
jgi:hypothetical protein